jgi:hypothetical protein
MPLAKYKAVIIECIDQLRQRKARPDAMRIAHLVARRHDLKTAETEAYLEQLVDSGDVLKVEASEFRLFFPCLGLLELEGTL